MNSKRIHDVLTPVIIAIAFTLISFVTAQLIPDRTWSNILLLGAMELVCIYVIVAADFNKSRQRFMVFILASQFAFYSVPYSILTWLFTNFNSKTVDDYQDSMYLMYEPVSAVVCSLLLILACLPKGLLNGFSTFARIDFHLSRINDRLGIHLFSIDKAKL